MELGNAMFGNSRGPVPIERGVGWEEELYRLFESYAPERDNEWREYGVEFENDTFSVFPYYWGGCTCGFEEMRSEWVNSQSHSPGCYQEEYDRLPYDGKHKWNKAEGAVEALCAKWGIEWNDGLGSAVHCTCGFDFAVHLWFFDHDHDPACPIVRPNFHYKVRDFRIDWYKYPLRDSYASRDISLDEFHDIIDNCIASVSR